MTTEMGLREDGRRPKRDQAGTGGTWGGDKAVEERGGRGGGQGGRGGGQGGRGRGQGGRGGG